MGIKYEDVEKAAQELQSRQKNVTGDNLRGVLGRGSKGTITKHLRQWKANNGVETVDESSVEPHLLKIVRELCNRINSNADDKITKHKEVIDKDLLETRALLDACKMENGSLKEKLEQVKQNLSQTEDSNQLLENNINDLQKNHAVLQGRFSALEKNNGEYKDEITRHHQLLKESQDQVVDLHKKIIDDRKLHSEAMDSLRHDSESKLSLLQSELHKMQIENASLSSDISHHVKQNQQLQDEIKLTSENYNTACKQRDDIQSENILLKNHLENEKNITSTLNEKLSQLNQENIDITIALRTSENSQNTQRETIASLENKLNLSETRCNQLFQEKMALEFALKAKAESVVN